MRKGFAEMCLVGGVLIFAGCATEQTLKLQSCRVLPAPGRVYDLADPGSVNGFIVASVQDRERSDARGEYLNDGAIFLLNRRTLEFSRPAVQGRDDYPFKPLGLDVLSDGKNLTLVVVNQGFLRQRSIEFYRIVNGALIFQRRSRIERLKNIVDVSGASEGYLLLAEQKKGWPLFGTSGGELIVYRNRFYRFQSTSLGGPERFGQSSPEGVTVPGVFGKKVLFLTEGIVRSSMDLLWQPVSAARTASALLVLLRDPGNRMRGRIAEIKGPVENNFDLPLERSDTMLVLSPEKKIVLAGESAGSPALAVCDQP